VSSDGKLIVSCSDGGSIRIFDFNTKHAIHRFKRVHTAYIETVAISQDCKYLISGSKDKSIKIFDLHTKQQIHHFKDAHEGRINSLAVTSDNKFIISVSDDSHIKIHRVSPIPSPPQNSNIPHNSDQMTIKSQILKSGMYFVYNGLFSYSNLNTVDDFLFNSEMPIKTVIQRAQGSQQLTVYPYAWNILHLVAIKAHHNFIQNMPDYADFKVPFLLDIFSKTPLHYLLVHPIIDRNSVNIMLTYICDYLDDPIQCQPYQALEIMISLTPLFFYLLLKTEIKVRKRFLDICLITLPLPFGLELPIFGKPKKSSGHSIDSLECLQYERDPKIEIEEVKDGGAKVLIRRTENSTVTVTNILRDFLSRFQEEKSEKVQIPTNTWKNENVWTQQKEDQIEIKASALKLDYDLMSKDMEQAIQCLKEQKSEEIFKVHFVMKLIDHLWFQTRKFLLINFALFSAYIIALSIYLTIEERILPFEIVILCCSSVFCLIEVLQITKARIGYLLDLWNWVDIIFHPLTIGFVIARIAGSRDELARDWVSAFVILFGYTRWVSYFRIFKHTRHLIQVIVTVIQEMWSFITIIILIIFGFSFIFLVFGRGTVFKFELYDAYGSLYGPSGDDHLTGSQKFFRALIAFLLNVILLNLLVSIMGTSYDKVLGKRYTTDSKTRLDLISDAITLLRFMRRGKNTIKRGFLIFCLLSNSSENEDEDEEEGNELEEKVSILRKDIKQIEDSMKTRIGSLEEGLSVKLERQKTAGETNLKDIIGAKVQGKSSKAQEGEKSPPKSENLEKAQDQNSVKKTMNNNDETNLEQLFTNLKNEHIENVQRMEEALFVKMNKLIQSKQASSSGDVS